MAVKTWRMRLQGDPALLASLVETFFHPLCKVALHGDQYYLYSTGFDEIQDAGDAYAIGEEISNDLNGFVCVWLGKEERVKVVVPEEIRDDGSVSGTVFSVGSTPEPFLQVWPSIGEDLPRMVTAD